MSTLSNKSTQELSELLDYYGVKHGPVVDSTRGLYEKKLKEAMAKERKPKTSPDKTYYREEEEEVTYYTYSPPITSDVSADRGLSRRSKQDYSERAFEDKPYIEDLTSTYRNVSSQQASAKSDDNDTQQANSSRLIPLWVQFLVFLAVAVFLYFVFSNMESSHSDPFKRVE